MTPSPPSPCDCLQDPTLSEPRIVDVDDHLNPSPPSPCDCWQDPTLSEPLLEISMKMKIRGIPPLNMQF